MTTEKKYRYFLNRKYRGKPGWWKTSTKLVAIISDQVNKFEWCIYVGNELQPAVDMFSKSIGISDKWEVGEVGGRVGHFFAYRPHRAGGIWFQAPPLKDYDVVAHECFHAVMYLVERMESKATEDQEEFMAYYLGFLVGQVHNICRNLT